MISNKQIEQAKFDAIRSRVWMVICLSKPWLSETYDSEVGARQGYYHLSKTFQGESWYLKDGTLVRGELDQLVKYCCGRCGQEHVSNRGLVARRVAKGEAKLCDDCFEGACDSREAARRES